MNLTQEYDWRRGGKINKHWQELMGISFPVATRHYIKLDYDLGFGWFVFKSLFFEPITNVLPRHKN